MTNTQRTILVTGAAGFIGSHVAQRLRRSGAHVVALDNLDPFYDIALKQNNLDAVGAVDADGSFECIEGDIRDEVLIERLFAEHRFASVIHLAARAGVRPSIDQPALYTDVNVNGTTVLLEAARRHGCRRFILASSSSVYGNNSKVPFAETDDVSNPISPYAATKRSCELIAHTYHALYGLPIACLRFFTVFGPRQRPDLAISRFLHVLDQQIPETMFGDGSASRDFTYIDDIVNGVFAALEQIDSHGFRIWNLGGSHPVTMNEVIEVISRVVGKASTIVPGPARPGDVDRTFADLTRSNAELGFAPTTTLEEGIARQWEWMQGRTSAATAGHGA